MTDHIHPIPHWFDDPGNVSVLLEHLATTGWSADDIVYAQSKPWKFEDEYLDALESIDEQVHANTIDNQE